MNSKLSIRTFTDYRSFLSAHAQDMKRDRAHWTFGMWAQRLGLKDTSSITKIMNGDRDPGDQITEKMISYFKFNGKDALYFKDLVRLSKIRKDPRLSVLLMEKMAKQHPNNMDRLLDEKTFSAISNWYYLPLREMTRLKDFKENPEWIAEQLHFKVGALDLRKALERLVDLGLLRRGRSGRLEVAEGQIQTTNDVANEAIKRAHEQTLENAKIAVRSIPLEAREFQCESLVINTENLPQAKQMIREFREKFSKTFEEEHGDSVYQIQLQFFPITKTSKKPKKDSPYEKNLKTIL